MTLTSQLYVSRSLLPASGREAMIADIVAFARDRNAALGVTGALVFTETMFAQLLEGDALAVERLMTRIRDDRRHTDLMLIDEHPIDARRFGRWSMAYAGPSIVATRTVSRAARQFERGSSPQADPIIKLMLAFAPNAARA